MSTREAWLIVSIPFLFCLGLLAELLIDMATI